MYVLENNKVRFIEVTTGITVKQISEVTSGVKDGMGSSGTLAGF